MPAPVKFKPEYIEQAQKLCLLGATDENMANFFDVDVRTIGNWKKSNPELFQAIKKGKVAADSEIAHSLYNRAKGYEWDEVQPVKLKQVEYNNGKRVREVERVEMVCVHKVVPPDTAAAIYWLKNRQRDLWRDKDLSLVDDGIANITSITYYPKALPRGYYEHPSVTSTDD